MGKHSCNPRETIKEEIDVYEVLDSGDGGIPIVIDGKIIGAIGASGGTGQQDGVASQAGINALK